MAFLYRPTHTPVKFLLGYPACDNRRQPTRPDSTWADSSPLDLVWPDQLDWAWLYPTWLYQTRHDPKEKIDEAKLDPSRLCPNDEIRPDENPTRTPKMTRHDPTNLTKLKSHQVPTRPAIPTHFLFTRHDPTRLDSIRLNHYLLMHIIVYLFTYYHNYYLFVYYCPIYSTCKYKVVNTMYVSMCTHVCVYMLRM